MISERKKNMYNVLVVDDEPIVRLAIKSLINWESYNYCFDLEASNGKQALAILNENTSIDIVITDINMPQMDGLELISCINRLDNPPKVLVLSAYNEYSLVRQAFKLGVSDYILKTEMNPDNILKLLSSLVSTDNGMAIRKQDEIQKGQLKESSINEILVIDNNKSRSDIESKIKEHRIRIFERNIIVCLIWVDDYQTIDKRYENSDLKAFTKSVLNAIYQILNDAEMGEAVSLSSEEYVLLLSMNSLSGINIRYIITDMLAKIVHSLKNYLNISVSIGVSNVGNSFFSIPMLLAEAKTNAKMRFLLGKGRIIYPEQAENISVDGHSSMIKSSSDFMLALKKGNTERIESSLEELLLSIKKFKPHKIDKVYTYYFEILYIIIKYLDEIGEASSEVFGEEIDFYQKITRFETIEEINNWIRNIVKWILSYLCDKKEVKIVRAVLRAKEFIDINFPSNITLKMVSDYVNLSESHLSTLFTKNIGCTFMDYLTNMRVDAAKQMISESDLKVYEICTKVGYVNVEHFSRVFKKITGMSPLSYKKMYGK
jgi:two-component system, response regulator YesN